MRIFILPSWCPTIDEPLNGTFFLEQAHSIAQARPEWTVAICQFDLGRSRVPWRPWHLPRFARDWISKPRMTLQVAPSGLYEYRLWVPYLPRLGSQNRRKALVRALGLKARIALESFIKEVGIPDLIHAQAVHPGGATAVALGREFGVPVGLTEHIGPFLPPTLCLPDGSIMPIFSEAYAGAARHSAVSRSLADRIVGLGLASKVEVLPNFLEDDFGSALPNPRKKSDVFSFLSVGWPSRGKGTDILLKAFARIGTNATLSIVGSSKERPFFQEMSADLGITDRVRWLGSVPREKMSDYYRESDAFVLPSRGETFGVVFIEALAHGKPLIATRCGGPEDIVHSENGLLVSVDSVDELATAMVRMIEQSGDYSPQALRADFLARFSASAVVDKIEDWYVAVINSGQRKAEI